MGDFVHKTLHLVIFIQLEFKNFISEIPSGRFLSNFNLISPFSIITKIQMLEIIIYPKIITYPNILIFNSIFENFRQFCIIMVNLKNKYSAVKILQTLRGSKKVNLVQ